MPYNTLHRYLKNLINHVEGIEQCRKFMTWLKGLNIPGDILVRVRSHAPSDLEFDYLRSRRHDHSEYSGLIRRAAESCKVLEDLMILRLPGIEKHPEVEAILRSDEVAMMRPDG